MLTIQQIKQWAIEATPIRIIVERFVENFGAPVHDYVGPSAVISLFAGRLVVLTPAASALVELPFEARQAVHERSLAALSESYRCGNDSGDVRLITALTLDVEHTSEREQSFTIRLSINHSAPRPLPAHMSALLRIVRDQLGVRADAVADAVDTIMTWVEPEPLGPAWEAGQVVLLPHVVTAFETHDTVYLRTGQLSVSAGEVDESRSSLYRLRDKVLTCVDNATVVLPTRGSSAPSCTAELEQHETIRWQLPCGGGVITRRGFPFANPPRIIVRRDDDRGIYVQRA